MDFFCKLLWPTKSISHTDVYLKLTHWGRVTHMYVGDLTIIGSDNGFVPVRRQSIILTHAGILLIRNLGTILSGILIRIYTFLFRKIHLKLSSAIYRQFCLGFNVLKPLHTLIFTTNDCLYSWNTACAWVIWSHNSSPTRVWSVSQTWVE